MAHVFTLITYRCGFYIENMCSQFGLSEVDHYSSFFFNIYIHFDYKIELWIRTLKHIQVVLCIEQFQSKFRFVPNIELLALQ